MKSAEIEKEPYLVVDLESSTKKIAMKVSEIVAFTAEKDSGPNSVPRVCVILRNGDRFDIGVKFDNMVDLLVGRQIDSQILE